MDTRDWTDVSVNDAVQLADRVWWVGHALPDDKFQCHVYLIENGTDSVLFDPGSKLTFKHVLKKVEQVVPFNHIRYFVCHHQDPDITGALPLIDKLITREDAVIVSHWRAIALLKHYGLELPFFCVEENGWALKLSENRSLEFIFTPYMHFPGAFCTFDSSTGVLFSSDIFGAFTEEFSLFAHDESFFEGMRFFHEHYMPSNEILFNGLTKLEAYNITMIAPQHGSVIPTHMLDFYFKQLKNVECGIYTLAQTSADILHLSKLNKVLRDFMETMIIHKSFSDIGQSILELIRRILPVSSFECWAINESDLVLHICESNLFKGVRAEMPDGFEDTLGMDIHQWKMRFKEILVIDRSGDGTDSGHGPETCAYMPLTSSENVKVNGLVKMSFSTPINLDDETAQTLLQIAAPLSVAVEREMIQRSMELEKQRLYKQAMTDSLTGLYTRVYMNEALQRIFSIQDRNPNTMLGVIIFDIDHFKRINDTYGHNTGDEVLKAAAGTIMDTVRDSDIPVRMGGEEFAVFITGKDAATSDQIAERVRFRVEALTFSHPMEKEQLTISAGVTFRNPGQTLEDLLHQADTALYQAKKEGRNRVVISGSPAP